MFWKIFGSSDDKINRVVRMSNAVRMQDLSPAPQIPANDADQKPSRLYLADWNPNDDLRLARHASDEDGWL